MIECLPAPDRCELCGADISEAGADAKAKRHESLSVIAMFSQIACEAPEALIAMLIKIHPSKLTLEQIGAILGISRQAVCERLQHADKMFAGWRPAMDDETARKLDNVFKCIDG